MQICQWLFNMNVTGAAGLLIFSICHCNLLVRGHMAFYWIEKVWWILVNNLYSSCCLHTVVLSHSSWSFWWPLWFVDRHYYTHVWWVLEPSVVLGVCGIRAHLRLLRNSRCLKSTRLRTYSMMSVLVLRNVSVCTRAAEEQQEPVKIHTSLLSVKSVKSRVQRAVTQIHLPSSWLCVITFI